MFRVVVTDDRFGSYTIEKQVLEEINARLEVYNTHDPEELKEIVGDADAILVNQSPMGADIISCARRARIIARYGIGYDNVDVDAASKRGIWVSNVQNYCNHEVTEQALAFIFGAVRRLPVRDSGVRRGGWNLHRDPPSPRLYGSVLGIVGYGGVGQVLHRRARSLGFSRILITDPGIDGKLDPADGLGLGERLEKAGRMAAKGGGRDGNGVSGVSEPDPGFGAAEAVGFEQLLAESDFVSIHVPLKRETRGLFDAQVISKMKQGSMLINTSRGPVVDETALAQALESGHLSAAGIDVYSPEPPASDSPLLRCRRALFSDHSAYYSESSLQELKRGAAENVRSVLSGRPPVYPLNGPF